MSTLRQKLQALHPPVALTLTPTLSAAEQTRLSWARPIRSYEAVPEVFKPFFTPGQPFPYCVLTPTYEGFMHRAAENLVCEVGEALYILEKSGNAYTVQCFPLAGIIYVELSTMLLDTQLKISGLAEPGGPATCQLRFNSVTDYLFTPIVERIRAVAVGSRAAPERAEMDKFDRWSQASFKFMNYGRRSLLGSEKVLESILQLEIRLPRFKILGKTFYKTISPTHASILTDRELIMIREEHLQAGGGKYGGTWFYLPLEKIGALDLAEREHDLLAFTIQMQGDTRFEFTFQAAAKPEITQLIAHFQELTL